MPPALPTAAALRARDEIPSLKDSDAITASINQLKQTNLSSLGAQAARTWVLFFQEVVANCVLQNQTLKHENLQQKEEIQQLKEKVESLNASLSRSTTVDELAAFEKHCVSLLKPTPFRSILRKVGFASVKEIANAGSSGNLRSCGVTHDSAFGKMVYDLISASDSTNDGPSFKKFLDDNNTRKLVWDKMLAVPAHQRLQVERNNLAKFGRDIVVMMYEPSPTLKTLLQKSEESTAMWAEVNHSIDQAANKVNDASGNEEQEDEEPAEYVHFVESLAGLYSAAHFGRTDSCNWIKHLLPLFACFYKYRARASTPLACNNSHRNFMSNVKTVMGELVGQTVRDIIKEGAFEALIWTQLVKFVRYIFQHKTDSLMVLAKNTSSPSPDLNECGTMDEDEFIRNHYIADVSVAKVYSTGDIEYFLKLRKEIKDTDRRLDRKRDESEKLVLSFPTPEVDASATTMPQPTRRRRHTAMSSPATHSSPTTLGAMHLLSEDSDDDSDTEPTNMEGVDAHASV